MKKLLTLLLVLFVAVPVMALAKGKKSAAPSGWVKLYDDKGFTDRILTVYFGRDVGNMHNVTSDDGRAGFNDKTSAVRYNIPAGWEVVLYEDNNYTNRQYVLRGKGEIPDLGYFNDCTTSLQWLKARPQ